MKRIALCATHDAVASNLTGVVDVFAIANTVWQMLSPQTDSPLFQVELYSADGRPVKTSSGFVLPVKGDAAALRGANADVLLVSSHYHTDNLLLQQYLQRLAPFTEIFRTHTQQNKLIGSFCNGSFFLAASGLLDHRKATTAWWLAKYFEKSFPQIQLQLDELVVIDGNLLTAGATTAYQHLCLELMRQLAGDALANQVSKVLLLDPNRTTQQAFMSCDIMTRQLCQFSDAHDDIIVRTSHYMQQNLTEELSLDALASRSAMSKRTFIRRFKQATGETPANYLQQLRVDEAKKLLETSHLTLEQIVPRVGYRDISAFRKLFQRSTGLTPKVYRQKFNPCYRQAANQ